MRGGMLLIAGAASLALVALCVDPAQSQELNWRAPQRTARYFQEEIAPPDAMPQRPLVEDTLPATPSFTPAPARNAPSSNVPLLNEPAISPEYYAPPPATSGIPTLFPDSMSPAPIDAIRKYEEGINPRQSFVTNSKPGIFQKLNFSGVWTEGGSDARAPGTTDLSTYAVFAFPLPIREWPLFITPGFDGRSLSGPSNRDIPGALFDSYLDFTWSVQINSRSSSTFSVAPGIYTDGDNMGRDAFRVTGKWVGTYDLIQHRLMLYQGVVYMGRGDITMLTVGGVIWTPNDFSRYEVIFPNPRAAWRTNVGRNFEDWVYLGADFYAGNTWGIERDDGRNDRLTFTEDRAVLGWERKVNGGAGLNLETGWSFDRKFHYRITPEANFRPDPTFYVRMGLTL